MAQNFLVASRHGSVFYFRRRVPSDLRDIVGQSAVVKTLATASKSAAITLARVYAVKTDAFFDRLRHMKKTSPESFELDYTLAISFDDDGQPTLKLEASPDETLAVQAVLSTAIQSLNQGRSGASTPIAPVVAVPKVAADQLLEDFLREGNGSGRWKDPEYTRHHEYKPIWSKFSPHANMHGLTLAAAEAYRAEVLASDASPQTKHRNFYRVHAVIAFGVTSHDLNPKMLERLKMPKVNGRSRKSWVKSYLPFTSTDLGALFHSDAYRANTFKKPSHFWLPMLGLYTGARIYELAALHLSSIYKDNEIHAITLSDGDTTDGGKNEYAFRQMPIHHELVEAGFLEYVEQLKGAGHDRLFPDIGYAARDGYGKRATDDFIAYRRSVGIGSDAGEKSRKVFHSFRSTLAVALFNNGVDGDLSRRLTGHAAIDVHQGTYLAAAAIPMNRAKKVLDEVSFNLVHSRFVDTAEYQKARARKKKSA